MKKPLLIIVIILAIITLAVIIFFSWLHSCPEGETFKLRTCSCSLGCAKKSSTYSSCARACGTDEIRIEKLDKLFGNE